MPAGLYIHFPFCAAKCPYCHFYSRPWDAADFRLWREGIEREAAAAAALASGLPFDTVYVGGGTPSLLGPGEVAWLRDLVLDGFDLRAAEFTLEANPRAGGADLLRGWREAGVTRLSVGVQSFDDEVLRTLGRQYGAEAALSFCRAAREAGFDSLSIDLMTGVPGERPGSAERSLESALTFGPDHVSLYLLENVEGLPFEEVLVRDPVDDDAAADAYARVGLALEAAGIEQYEVSNFARPGKACRHNLKYWRYEPFLGLGPAAASHAGGRRWHNRASLEEWAEALGRNESAREDVVELRPEQAAREALVFGLRLVEGVDLAALGGRFGVNVEALFGREAGELVSSGLLIREGATLRIPPEKFIVSNRILAGFV